VWDHTAMSLQEVKSYHCKSPIVCLAQNPRDEKSIVSFSQGGNLREWNSLFDSVPSLRPSPELTQSSPQMSQDNVWSLANPCLPGSPVLR
jgi:hypothetical protein